MRKKRQFAFVLNILLFVHRERRDQEQQREMLEKQQKEKERERMEREREREKQEREEKERRDQENAASKLVSRHFEESLRLANQKVNILKISSSVKIIIFIFLIRGLMVSYCFRSENAACRGRC